MNESQRPREILFDGNHVNSDGDVVPSSDLTEGPMTHEHIYEGEKPHTPNDGIVYRLPKLPEVIVPHWDDDERESVREDLGYGKAFDPTIMTDAAKRVLGLSVPSEGPLSARDAVRARLDENQRDMLRAQGMTDDEVEARMIVANMRRHSRS